jgi:hypothetical protein
MEQLRIKMTEIKKATNAMIRAFNRNDISSVQIILDDLQKILAEYKTCLKKHFLL